MKNSMVSMRVLELGGEAAELKFAAVSDESNTLRLVIDNCDWQISISKAWMDISDSGKHVDSVTHISGTTRQKERTFDTTIVIDCGLNPPVLTFCLPITKGRSDRRRFEITHHLQEEVISLISTITYIEPIRPDAQLKVA
jgi:hypothetical protein